MKLERKLAGNIKYLRRQRGLTQKELGLQLGISGNAISNWEKGQDEPKNRNLHALADFFEVSIEQITKWDLSTGKKVETTQKVEEPTSSELVGVIVRLERKLQEFEKFFEETADPDTLRKLIELRNRLIDENPKRAQELGLTKK